MEEDAIDGEDEPGRFTADLHGETSLALERAPLQSLVSQHAVLVTVVETGPVDPNVILTGIDTADPWLNVDEDGVVVVADD